MIGPQHGQDRAQRPLFVPTILPEENKLADPLLCPRCGGTMKIIAFIEAHQSDIIRKILQHCGLWQDPPARSPPRETRPSHPGDQAGDPDSRLTCEVDPDFLEFARREEIEEPEPTWEP
jgi:hypothetical protein